VFGQDNAGLGLYGTGNVAVWGESTGSGGGSDGVHGVAPGPASGVAGINDNASGVGVWGQSPGWSFYSAGNVAEDRASGGWAKAMVYGNGKSAPYSIVRCFNSALTGTTATTPPCGIDLQEVYAGYFRVDFGFEVDDRFASVTLQNWSGNAPQMIVATPSPNNGDITKMNVYTYDGSQSSAFDFYLVIF
jgi:hypothetical protein